MAENEVEKMLDHLRRIKSGGNMTRFMIVEIEKLELVLRVLRTVIKYYHVLLMDPVELAKKAKWTVKELQWVVDECRTIFNLERLESHLLEFFEGNTSLSYNYELNDFDMSKYMDCLGKILNDVQMMFLERCRLSPLEKLEIHQFTKKLKIVQKKMKFLRYLYAAEINGYVNHEKLECLETRIQLMANNVGQFCFSVLAYVAEIEVKDENYIFNTPPYLLSLFVFVELEMKKIFLGEVLKASKFTQSKTFKDKKLPKEFSHHLHILLMYLRNKKFENFPNNIPAQNIDVAIDFLLVLTFHMVLLAYVTYYTEPIVFYSFVTMMLMDYIK